jgi:hypothetical protein
MRRIPLQFASSTGREGSRRRTAVAVWALVCAVVGADAAPLQNRLPGPADGRLQERSDEARRKEGEALIGLADSAMSGRAPSDFSIQWRNDFLKAQNGTFVPFTLTVDRSTLTAASLLMYVRAARRDASSPARGRGAFVRYPFDIIFPVDIPAPAGHPLRITRGFAVPAGDYDVYVALRERPADPLGAEPRLRAAVLKQPLTVPDFWSGELTTSTVIVADRIDTLPAPIAGDEVLERPYVIGQNEIHPAAGTAFKKDRELIVVFLIYNPAVSPEKHFEIQVDYHLFRKVPAGTAEPAPVAGQPAARAGERYVTRTNPQRFTPPVMGEKFDPAAGQPMLAGQGILLSSFQDGEYRLGITVTDQLSRRTVSRDVVFTVVGS